MTHIERINPPAAVKLRKIDPKLYASYPAYENKWELLGQTTSNDAEQEMMRFKRENIRSAKSPLEFFQAVVVLWQRLVAEAVFTTQTCLETRQMSTPYAITTLKHLRKSATNCIQRGNEITVSVTAQDRKLLLSSHTQYSKLDMSVVHVFRYHIDSDGFCNCGSSKYMTGFLCEHELKFHEASFVTPAIFQERAISDIWKSSTFIKCFPLGSAIVFPSAPIVIDDLVVRASVVTSRRGRPDKHARREKKSFKVQYSY